MDIDLPTVVAEVNDAVRRYETAPMTNDVVVLDELFWRNPRTVRFGAGKSLRGFTAIAAFRQSWASSWITRSDIIGLGSDVVVAHVEFERLVDRRYGRQSQTWIKGWWVASSPVSLLPGA